MLPLLLLMMAMGDCYTVWRRRWMVRHSLARLSWRRHNSKPRRRPLLIKTIRKMIASRHQLQRRGPRNRHRHVLGTFLYLHLLLLLLLLLLLSLPLVKFLLGLWVDLNRSLRCYADMFIWLMWLVFVSDNESVTVVIEIHLQFIQVIVLVIVFFWIPVTCTLNCNWILCNCGCKWAIIIAVFNY